MAPAMLMDVAKGSEQSTQTRVQLSLTECVSVSLFFCLFIYFSAVVVLFFVCLYVSKCHRTKEIY